MSAKKGKTSRNRQRKTAYAALANKGSRNQDALSGPVIGHFETVTHETRRRVHEDGTVREYEVEVNPYQKIVHDDDGANAQTTKSTVGNHVPRPQGAVRKNGK